MKILMVVPRLPLPADTGGKIRTWNLLKQVSRFSGVRLACFSFSQDDQKFIPELSRLGIETTLVPAPESHAAKKVSGVLFGALPYSIAKYDSRNMRQAVSELTSREHFDLVHIDHIHMAHYCKLLNGVPVSQGPRVPALLDEHNVEYKILERCADVERNPVHRILYGQQAQKMKRFERMMAPQFHICTAVSEDDAKILRELTDNKARIEVVPNGVDTEYFSAQEHKSTRAPEGISGTLGRWDAGAPEAEEALVFTGSMDWLPNEDAVVYFISRILPLIWETKPQVKLYVVGKNPSCGIRKAGHHDERIVVTGCVDDVRAYLNRAKVFVAPLRIGGGTRLKILEAMAMEKPVVATSVGAEGIAHTAGRDILIADTPSEFAQKVIELLDKPEQARQIAQEARQLAVQKYDWNIVGRKLRNVYEELIHEQKH